MKELIDEQYRSVLTALNEAGFLVIWMNTKLVPTLQEEVQVGRAAYAASFPYAVAEALAFPTVDEIRAASPTRGVTNVDAFVANRLARLTAKPDPAVEAAGQVLADLGIGYKVDDISDETLRKLVAAVRSADGAK